MLVINLEKSEIMSPAAADTHTTQNCFQKSAKIILGRGNNKNHSIKVFQDFFTCFSTHRNLVTSRGYTKSDEKWVLTIAFTRSLRQFKQGFLV